MAEKTTIELPWTPQELLAKRAAEYELRLQAPDEALKEALAQLDTIESFRGSSGPSIKLRSAIKALAHAAGVASSGEVKHG